MNLATVFKAGILPICAIIISLTPFRTFSQPHALLLPQHSYNNASSKIISDWPYIDVSMMNASVPIANFYIWSDSGKLIISYYQQGVGKQRADQATIASLGIQAQVESWLLPKKAWVETKKGVEEEEEDDAMWYIVTRKENEGAATYSLDEFAFKSTDPTASFAFADMELIDIMAIILLVDVFGLYRYLYRNQNLKLAHVVITYAMAYCLLLK